MSTITKIHYSHPDMALAHTIRSLPRGDVRVLPEVATDPQHNMYYIVFEGEFDQPIDDILAEDHTVEEAKLMSDYGDQLVYGIIFTDETKLIAPKVTEVGGMSLDARSFSNGWIERWQLPSREVLAEIWEYARDNSFTFDVLELHQISEREHDDGYGLTAEQHEALVTAFERGYFEEPRGISLVELADELGISPAAASGRLRRGLTRLIGMTIVDPDTERVE
ncbi:Transcriptional regulator, contains HTH domain [Halalkaliarchaeum sp. AArc-CO]|uniref:helix-turn-helix domain-containing protein n=1 Tax=unclassified Halalkaliarchaeum TaxID=2678344 RepID=UPI00217D73DF|nr:MULTISPECIES: helix-turn-helix domain-containing protein [unclassified Halalkaliarchaeum]MDR5672050.1 helix-turn-helix domain-containing protein [Halalkaliarchaeum sp. AArc-GB]UWG51548.1 Transcriptional regulator, contains HTH domain [Halalkaliarchaeum sp. AArc-CO]